MNGYGFRQRLVLYYLLHSKASNIGEAMRKAGYSNAYAHNPQKLLRTKAMQKLIDQLNISNAVLAKYFQWRLDLSESKNSYMYNPTLDLGTLKLIDIICRIRGDYYSPESYAQTRFDIRRIQL